MPASRIAVLTLPVAAGALAWFLLAADPRPPARVPDAPGTERPATPRVPAEVRPVVPGPVPVEAPSVPADPEWIAKDLPALAGKGPLKGSELVDAVEKAGPLRFHGATAADLAALRAAVFEEVDRGVTAPYAAMMGWLKEAGFEVEVAYPTLTVRRRTDEDWTGR